MAYTGKVPRPWAPARVRAAERQADGEQCAIEGCFKLVYQLGAFCKAHHQQGGWSAGPKIKLSDLVHEMRTILPWLRANRQHHQIAGAVAWITERLQLAADRHAADPWTATQHATSHPGVRTEHARSRALIQRARLSGYLAEVLQHGYGDLICRPAPPNSGAARASVLLRGLSTPERVFLFVAAVYLRRLRVERAGLSFGAFEGRPEYLQRILAHVTLNTRRGIRGAYPRDRGFLLTSQGRRRMPSPPILQQWGKELRDQCEKAAVRLAAVAELMTEKPDTILPAEWKRPRKLPQPPGTYKPRKPVPAAPLETAPLASFVPTTTHAPDTKAVRMAVAEPDQRMAEPDDIFAADEDLFLPDA